MEPMASAASPTGRQPAAKKRRNAASATATPVGLPPPATSSLNDLATLAAAVAEEPYGDDPILADQEQLQDQGMLAYAAGGAAAAGVLASQAEMAAGSARTARGASRAGRQRTPAPSSSGADEGDSLGLSFPLVNEDGKPLVSVCLRQHKCCSYTISITLIMSTCWRLFQAASLLAQALHCTTPAG